MINRLQSVFKSLHSHDVKYVVIGDIAVVLHGVPRATFDLDILIEASPENAQRLLAALLEAGLATAALTTPQKLLEREITIFNDIVRIDVQTTTPGLVFQEAWEHRETMKYQGQPIYVVSLTDLIAAKRAAGRTVDLEDVKMLEENETKEGQ